MKVKREVLVAATIIAPLLLAALVQMAVGDGDPALGRRIVWYGTVGSVFLVGVPGLLLAGLGWVAVARRHWAGGLPGTFGCRPRKQLQGLAAVAVGLLYVLLGIAMAAATGHMLYLLVSAGRSLGFV